MRVNDRHVSFYYEDDHDYGEVEIDKKKTALLLIDIQHVFVSRPIIENPTETEKMHAQKWEQFYEKIDEEVIPNNQKLLEAFRKNNMEVIFAKIQSQTKNGRERSLDHKASGYNDLLQTANDPLSDIVPQLKPLDDEIIVLKTTDSALTGSSLRLWLNNMGIDTIVVTGVLLDQCVSCTVRSLADESFNVWLIEDAVRASTQQIQDSELEILNNIYCHVINTEECIAAIK